jgi:hypothetical protein
VGGIGVRGKGFPPQLPLVEASSHPGTPGPSLGQHVVMLEAAPQEPAGAAGVTLTVENGAILSAPPL